MQVQHTIRVGTLRPQIITVTVTEADLSDPEKALPNVVKPMVMAITAERHALTIKRSHYSGKRGVRIGEKIRARVTELDGLYAAVTGLK